MRGADLDRSFPSCETPPAVHKIVVLPFTSDPARGVRCEGDADAVVTTRVLQALTQETNLDVVPPGEAAHVGPAGKTPSGTELRKQFGVDAILTGVVHRYVERIGRAERRDEAGLASGSRSSSAPPTASCSGRARTRRRRRRCPTTSARSRAPGIAGSAG